MAFQFQCPHGHLLEGEESQAHEHCHCPECGVLFVIPPPPPTYAHQSAEERPDEESPLEEPPIEEPPIEEPPPLEEPPLKEPSFPQVSPQVGPPTEGEVRIDPGAETAAASFEKNAAPKIFHIPCPSGHVLDAPAEMLNQDVLCPHCGVQFRLRERNSAEYIRKQQIEDERRENRVGQIWMNWAIVVAVLVIICLLLLIFSSR